MVTCLPQEQESAREPDDEANEDEREEGEESEEEAAGEERDAEHRRGFVGGGEGGVDTERDEERHQP